MAKTKTAPAKKAATTTELQSTIEDHLTQTVEHVSRLEEVFEIIGQKAQAKKCDAMEGLLKEGDSIVATKQRSSMLMANFQFYTHDQQRWGQQ